MGCCSSQTIEKTDLCAEKCAAGAGIAFSEKSEAINGELRNTCSWIPEMGFKGIVFICHGLNEHALNYYSVAIPLATAGYGVFGIDHVSHGKSEGKAGIITDFTKMPRDFATFANMKIDEYDAKKPVFIVAHSMGTLVATLALNNIKDVKAIVLSGAAIFAGPGASSPFGCGCLYPLSQTSFAGALTSCTSVLDPGGLAAPLVLADLTSNKEELELIKQDSRRSVAYVSNKTAYELLKMVELVKSEISNIAIPFLCIHGGNDKICLKKGSEFIYKNAGTDITQRRIEIFEGLRHELFHEVQPQSGQCIAMVVDYFEAQFSAVS